ncbi:hypothetical protein [Caloramator sp. ALD01]|uniref:hypothetical protein n=1 Tax=Caloramator sp. ALD01 TaxID=1031288 RepID=UPI0004879A35|nr:hypothetical protein [Caloramator sp. ALD01]
MSSFGKIIYPEQFLTNKILMHSECEQEMKEFLEKSGYKSLFTRQFRLRIKYIEDRWTECYQKKDWFEILKASDGLYCMRFKSMKNLRIIFKFTDLERKNIVILLCTFEEKDTKHYKNAIKIANKRLEEIIYK